MASDLAAVKQHLWSEIERRRDELAQLCADGLKLPAENPPGDTRDIADYYATILGHANLPVERFEPRHGRVSLVSTQPGREERPRFVFNGHLDHFPSDDPTLWSFPPYGGEIRDGNMSGTAMLGAASDQNHGIVNRSQFGPGRWQASRV